MPEFPLALLDILIIGILFQILCTFSSCLCKNSKNLGIRHFNTNFGLFANIVLDNLGIFIVVYAY